MPIRKLPKIMFEHTKAGFPDPCIKVREGSGKALLGIVFNPFSSVLIEVGKGQKDLKKLRYRKKVKRCLW